MTKDRLAALQAVSLPFTLHLPIITIGYMMTSNTERYSPTRLISCPKKKFSSPCFSLQIYIRHFEGFHFLFAPPVTLMLNDSGRSVLSLEWDNLLRSEGLLQSKELIGNIAIVYEEHCKVKLSNDFANNYPN